MTMRPATRLLFPIQAPSQHSTSTVTNWLELVSFPFQGTVERINADVIEDNINADRAEDELSSVQSALIKSHKDWQREMAKWVEETKRMNALDDSELESDDKMLATALYGQKCLKWLPRSLNLLFGPKGN